ncbi:MAG TPA: hypothetical protein VHE81_23280, partial [Lacipirellulaceae bacterium]|nr:hypothetical protein [Lacipirellulaceae bacterium]
AFAVALCAIVLIANLVGYWTTGNSNVGLITFLCFLPMAFLMTDLRDSQIREYVESLESRIRQLEELNNSV